MRPLILQNFTTISFFLSKYKQTNFSKQQSINRKQILRKANKKQKQNEGPRYAKAWDLINSTSKLSLSENENKGEDCVVRILKIKQKPQNKTQNQVLEYQQKLMNYRASSQLHTRLLARLVSQFGGNLHKYLLDYLLVEDKQKIPLKLDLCVQWLYDEYQIAFDQFMTTGRDLSKCDSNYNTCLFG